jgi:hypothetical protein
MHLTQFAGMILDLRERRKTFELLYSDHAPDRAEVVALRPRTMRALARESLRLALVAHREQPGEAVISEYLDFARETDPTIVADPLWKLCQMGPLAGRTFPAVRVRRLASRVRGHVMWRHERRYGI